MYAESSHSLSPDSGMERKSSAKLECCYRQPNSGLVTSAPSKQFLYPNHGGCESNSYLGAVLHGKR